MANAVLGFTLNDANVGAFTQAFSATVSGVARVIDVDQLSITDRLSAPSSAEVFVRGFTPAELAEVRLYNGGTGGVCLFGGNAVVTECDATRLGDDPWWKLSCQDYTWQLNRYKRVKGSYDGIGINTCLRQLLAAYTDGFRVGYCPAALGNVRDLTLDDVAVTDALDQLASTCQGFWDVDADKRVHIFTDPDHLSTDSVALTASSKNFSGLKVSRDASDIATRVIVHGRAVQCTAYTGSASTTLPVDETSPFVGASTSAGAGFTAGSPFAYTGVSVPRGPGSLTGVSGLTADVPQGEAVMVRVVAEDATAQSDLATLLGGGLSGIAEITIVDGNATLDLATGSANAALERRKATFVSVSYRAQDQTHTGAQQTVVGQTVDVTVTAPVSVSGTFRVQEVGLGLKSGGKVVTTTLGFERRISLAPYFRGLQTVKALARARIARG